MEGGRKSTRELPRSSSLTVLGYKTVIIWHSLSKLSSLPILNTSPRKYNNSGLRKNPKTKKTQVVHDPFESGGLNDDDVVSVRPNFPPKPLVRTYAFYGKPEKSSIKRDLSRQNAVRSPSIQSQHYLHTNCVFGNSWFPPSLSQTLSQMKAIRPQQPLQSVKRPSRQ